MSYTWKIQDLKKLRNSARLEKRTTEKKRDTMNGLFHVLHQPRGSSRRRLAWATVPLHRAPLSYSPLPFVLASTMAEASGLRLDRLGN